MKYIKLTTYAKNMAITYRTAWNHFNAGKIVGAITSPSGTILVPEYEEQIKESRIKNCVIYTRVSSSENKGNLEGQANRLKEFAEKNGLRIVEIIKEIGSGVNDKRPKLIKLLESKEWDVILVEHKDRLTRFGFNYLEVMVRKEGKEILVVNIAEEVKNDLMEDLVSIIYSFSARLYGIRRGKNKANRVIEELKNDKDI